MKYIMVQIVGDFYRCMMDYFSSALHSVGLRDLTAFP